MAWGKSDEDKAAEAAERERQAAAAAQEAERRAHAATPVGQAEAAKARGDGFFQIEIDISRLSGASSAFGSSGNAIARGRARTDVLGQIEQVGWRLEHVGYVFIETGATTTNRVLSTGQGTVTQGVVTGIYLFRDTNSQ